MSELIEEQLAAIPVLPLRDVVVYPHMVIPLFVGRERSILALDKAMDRETLEQLVETARYAPTASNAQALEWQVFTDKDAIKDFSKMTVDWIRSAIEKATDSPRASYLPAIIAAWDLGYDAVLRGAPALVVASAPKEAGSGSGEHDAAGVPGGHLPRALHTPLGGDAQAADADGGQAEPAESVVEEPMDRGFAVGPGDADRQKFFGWIAGEGRAQPGQRPLAVLSQDPRSLTESGGVRDHRGDGAVCKRLVDVLVAVGGDALVGHEDALRLLMIAARHHRTEDRARNRGVEQRPAEQVSEFCER